MAIMYSVSSTGDITNKVCFISLIMMVTCTTNHYNFMINNCVYLTI